MNIPRLRSWPLYLRAPIAAFIVVSLAGYAAGLVFVASNTGLRAQGISDHYHGSEQEMKFGKSGVEMLEIVHTHLLGMGLLFFAVAMLFAATDVRSRWKTWIATETLLSLLSTFGGLWLVAVGQRWAVWLIYPSSVLMIAGYAAMSLAVLHACMISGRIPPDQTPPLTSRPS
jgi:hypothetical protein